MLNYASSPCAFPPSVNSRVIFLMAQCNRFVLSFYSSVWMHFETGPLSGYLNIFHNLIWVDTLSICTGKNKPWIIKITWKPQALSHCLQLPKQSLHERWGHWLRESFKIVTPLMYAPSRRSSDGLIKRAEHRQLRILFIQNYPAAD